MDKQTFLSTYTDIETKTFARTDKNKKLTAFFESLQSEGILFSLADTLDLIHQLNRNKIQIRQPLFNNILYPILSEHIEKNHVDAIKALIELEQLLISYQGYKNDHTYTVWGLIKQGLSISPDDLQLLTLSEEETRDYILHTLHEIPFGVLYGMDGATSDQCDELIELAHEYKGVCKKLNLDRQELIEECQYYYSAYKSYLSVFKNYSGFADYLKQESESEREQ